MLDANTEKEFFTVTLNSVPATIGSITTVYDSLSLMIFPYILYGDEIRVSYAGGNVRSRYNGKLQDFSGYLVPNTISEPQTINSYNNTENSDILIFPNPALSEIEVSCGFLFNTLTILSIDGKIVTHKEYSIPLQSERVSLNLEAGLYLVILRSENKFSMNKLVIE